MLQAQMDKEAQIRRRLQEVSVAATTCQGQEATLWPHPVPAVSGWTLTTFLLLALLAAGWGARGSTGTARSRHDQEPEWPDPVHPCFGRRLPALAEISPGCSQGQRPLPVLGCLCHAP